MKHQIEVTTANLKDSMNVSNICVAVMNNHAGARFIEVDGETGRGTVIHAECNGAALRDLITELDRAGFLD